MKILITISHWLSFMAAIGVPIIFIWKIRYLRQKFTFCIKCCQKNRGGQKSQYPSKTSLSLQDVKTKETTTGTSGNGAAGNFCKTNKFDRASHFLLDKVLEEGNERQPGSQSLTEFSRPTSQMYLNPRRSSAFQCSLDYCLTDSSDEETATFA